MGLVQKGQQAAELLTPPCPVFPGTVERPALPSQHSLTLPGLLEAGSPHQGQSIPVTWTVPSNVGGQ